MRSDSGQNVYPQGWECKRLFSLTLECGYTKHKGTTITQEKLTHCSNITVVCGKPGSGKTYYVAQHKAPDDLVWDYDVTMAAGGSIDSVLAQRDAFRHTAEYSQPRAWVIITRRDSILTQTLATAGAAVIELVIDEQTRLRRLIDRETPTSLPRAGLL